MCSVPFEILNTMCSTCIQKTEVIQQYALPSMICVALLFMIALICLCMFTCLYMCYRRVATAQRRELNNMELQWRVVCEGEAVL